MMLCGGIGSLLASHLFAFGIGAVSAFAIVTYVLVRKKNKK